MFIITTMHMSFAFHDIFHELELNCAAVIAYSALGIHSTRSVQHPQFPCSFTIFPEIHPLRTRAPCQTVLSRYQGDHYTFSINSFPAAYNQTFRLPGTGHRLVYPSIEPLQPCTRIHHGNFLFVYDDREKVKAKAKRQKAEADARSPPLITSKKKRTTHAKENNKQQTIKWRTFERCSKRSAKKFASPTLTPRMAARMARRCAVRLVVLLSRLRVLGKVIWGVRRIVLLWRI